MSNSTAITIYNPVQQTNNEGVTKSQRAVMMMMLTNNNTTEEHIQLIREVNPSNNDEDDDEIGRPDQVHTHKHKYEESLKVRTKSYYLSSHPL